MKPVIIIAIAFALLIPIPIFAPSHPEYVEPCNDLGTERIDGECQITNYKLYNEYRITHIENFPDPEKSPQHYIDRYNAEPSYKLWFDGEFPNKSIESVVSYRETHVEGFPDNSKSPEYYVKQLHDESSYEVWFDGEFPTFQIYNIVGIDSKQNFKILNAGMSEDEIPNPCNFPEPQPATEYQGDVGLNDPTYMEAFRESQYQYDQEKQDCLREYQIQIDQRVAELEKPELVCGTGTIEKDGICVPDYPDTEPSSKGGGCLIATATYGSELAPQVQQLRELRDNKLLNTESGTSFMDSFNDFYYTFSPIIADYERENPLFRAMVKIVITPMISSLSILNYVDLDSEVEVLGYGVSLILLNIGMYFGIPAIVIMRIRK